CAATSVVIHLLKAGDHVVVSDDLYGGTFRLFDKVFKNHGIEFSFVDLTQPQNLSAAIKKNTRMVWVETPTNPMLKLIDIKAVVDQIKGQDILVAVDNTFMSPYFQRPLEWGADLVIHS